MCGKKACTLLRRARACVAMAAIACCFSYADAARADGTATDKAAAQTLFDEGRHFMDQEKYIEACARFADSQRLDPGGGTLLNLASCHEKLGKTATAWSEFNEALSWAIRDGRTDRQSFARERIAVLEPKLARLTVKVADAAIVEGFELKLDGAVLGKPAWGVGAPVDPGEHVVIASAPRRISFTGKVTVVPRDNKSLEIPALAEDPNAPPIEPPKPIDDKTHPPVPPSEDHGSRRTIGFFAGAVGIAGLGVGTFFGLQAISKWSDSNKGCPNNQCSVTGASAAGDAKTAAQVADVAFVVGVVGVGVGAYLVLSSPSSSASATTAAVPARVGIRLAPTSRGGGLLLDGAW